MFSDRARHVGFINEHGLDSGGLDAIWAIAKNHTGVVPDAFDGEAKGFEPLQAAELVVELFQPAEGIVLEANLLEFDTGGANASFGVGDAEEDDAMPSLLQAPGECGEGVQVPGAGKAECSKNGHGSNFRDGPFRDER